MSSILRQGVVHELAKNLPKDFSTSIFANDFME